MASVFPLFGSAFLRNLGLGPGSSLFAGISILMVPIYFVSFPPTLFFCKLFLRTFVSSPSGMVINSALVPDKQHNRPQVLIVLQPNSL